MEGEDLPSKFVSTPCANFPILIRHLRLVERMESTVSAVECHNGDTNLKDLLTRIILKVILRVTSNVLLQLLKIKEEENLRNNSHQR